jgi:predicted nucleic-acid-binding Zn-ribbon protein
MLSAAMTAAYQGAEMKAQCPQCGFVGSVRDDLIPEGGRTIACPKCRNTFFVHKEAAASSPPQPGDRGAGHPQDRAEAAPSGSRPAPTKTSPVLIIGMAVLFLALGFYGGYQYRGYIGGKSTPPSRVEKPKKAPKKGPAGGPMRSVPTLMTPMTTPEAAIPPGKPSKPGAETSFTADDLFNTLAAMPPGQARNFCRKNSSAEVNGSGTIREITKTGTSGGVIGTYNVGVEYSADRWVVIESKMTKDYLSNFKVGATVSFVGTLADYQESGKRKTIRLADGMIIVK